MMKIDKKNEYAEVAEILQYINKEDYKKIPQKEIDFFNNFKKNDFGFKYNSNKRIYEQEISRNAYIILLSLYMDYIFETRIQNYINDILILNEKQKENEINYKLKVKPIFLKENINLNEEHNKEKKELIEVKRKNIFQKIISIIKKLIKRN